MVAIVTRFIFSQNSIGLQVIVKSAMCRPLKISVYRLKILEPFHVQEVNHNLFPCSPSLQVDACLNTYTIFSDVFCLHIRR